MRIFILCLLVFSQLHADPLQDQQQFRQTYQKLFPQLALKDYANGVYAIDEIARGSWQAIEEFPPYEAAIEQGEALFKMPFKNGRHYADCFANKGIGIANQYPQWQKQQGEVITLEKALNDCRIANREPPLSYQRGDIANLLAYMAFTSRGKPIETIIPQDDPRALIAYEQGKEFFNRRQGKLNFSCATCHVENAGKLLRSEMLSPSLGHPASWPTYRLKWGEMGTLHRRFSNCFAQLKIPPLPAQSKEFRNLEYYLSFMSNGVPISGPSTRK
jgi:sulfur-oxidizing protein SoxA